MWMGLWMGLWMGIERKGDGDRDLGGSHGVRSMRGVDEKPSWRGLRSRRSDLPPPHGPAVKGDVEGKRLTQARHQHHAAIALCCRLLQR